jgi:predicted ATPase/DNA-binding SARP family transcriptional activator
LIASACTLEVVLVALLGPLVVVGDDGGPLPVPPAPKARAVLELLALRPGAAVQNSELIDALWGEDPPRSAPKALQVYVSELRRGLPPESIRTEVGGYSLRVAPDDVDAIRFERSVREGRQLVDGGEAALAAPALTDALGAWRGEPLVELAGHSAGAAEVARLSELRRMAEESLVDARLELGEHTALVANLERAVAAEPLRERRWAQLMIALYRCGRQADALAAYQRMRRQLGDDLGLEPSPQLVELERAILVHDPALGAAAATPRGPRRARGNLPATISSFIERPHATAAIHKLLEERRLVTLTGAGGCGKTRLAIHVASGLTDAFRSGVWFVDLAPAERRDEVEQAFAASLGVRHGSERPLGEVLSEYVAGQHLLLVADNCEHVIDEAAGLIGRLLAAGSKVKVLATSREPLQISGEANWRVSPLGIPASDDDLDAVRSSESVRLFIERARDVEPTMSADDQSVAVIGEIASLLDGLPLAIELAAALANVMSVSDILDRLDDRFGLLVHGPRTVSPRQQALAATLDWSYQLLSSAEQLALRRLSVFGASFDLDAARAVVSPSPEAPQPSRDGDEAAKVLWRLTSKSLVTPAESPRSGRRFRLLDSTREYARQRLVDSGESVEADDAITEYFFGEACAAEEVLAGPEQGGKLAALRADHENLRRAVKVLSSHRQDMERALRMLTALQRYWLVRGDQGEWLELARRSTETRGAPIPAGTRARALAAQCVLGSFFDPVGARRWGQQALRHARRSSDIRAECESLVALSHNAILSARAEVSIAHRCLALAREVDDPVLIGEALFVLASSSFDDSASALERSDEALEYLRNSGDILYEVFMLNNIGLIYDYAGDLDRAASHVEEAVVLADRIGYGFPIGLVNLAEYRIRTGQPSAAVEPAHDALELARRYSLLDVLVAIRVIVGVAVAHGDYLRGAALNGYYDASWVAARFEASIFVDPWVEANISSMRGALGGRYDTEHAAGSSLQMQNAVELAEQVIAAAKSGHL